MPDAPTGEPDRDEIMKALNEFHTELDKKADKKSFDPEKIIKIEKFLDAQEILNQKRLTEKKELEKREAEANDRIDTLELELARSGGPGNGKSYKDTPEYKALNSFFKLGADIDIEQKAFLRTDSDTAGGYLITPTELDSYVYLVITLSLLSLTRVWIPRRFHCSVFRYLFF